MLTREPSRALRQTLQAGPAGGLDSIQYRACAVLYSLLLDHRLDQRGHCRSCRRSGAMIWLRRRPCRIHLRASYWLFSQPDEALLPWHLASELGLGAVPDGRPPTGKSLVGGGQPDPSPVIPNPAAAAQALCDHFLANADRGDHAANDELVTELLRRIRSR